MVFINTLKIPQLIPCGVYLRTQTLLNTNTRTHSNPIREDVHSSPLCKMEKELLQREINNLKEVNANMYKAFTGETNTQSRSASAKPKSDFIIEF